METRIISIHDSNAIKIAIETLHKSRLVAFPTDTVYGLAALPLDKEGILNIYEAKGRDFAKALPVLIGETSHLPQIAEYLPDNALKLAERFWPGALTLIIPKNSGLLIELTPYSTVGVRMPDHSFTRELLRATGPLATTSANISGGDNTLDAQSVFEQLQGKIDLILDGGKTPGAIPSTVVDCSSNEIKILRHGAISDEEILSVIK
jgi:L-threonylcarbamoyladenylate synthase